MAGKIFYRERMKVKEGTKTPRFRVLAVSGTDLKIYGHHLRHKELKQIAKETGCELIALERNKEK